MQLSKLQHNPENRQFVLGIDDQRAFIDYELRDGVYYLVHSEVPAELRGGGIGKRLVEETFAAIEREGARAVAVCGYIKLIARRSPKWHEWILQ